MTWYYVPDDQKQTGPVSEPEFEQLTRSGRVTPETLVWREGMADWQAYGTLSGGPLQTAVVTENANAGLSPCSMCQRDFPTGDMLQFERAWVCAECKPLFIQKLREGGRIGAYGLWRSKKTLIMRRDAALPPRCVKCNTATTDRLPRKLYWHPALIYLLIFVHLLVYAIVAVIIRKRADVEVALCPEHRSKRRTAILIVWLMILGMIVCIVLAVTQNMPLLGLPALILLLGALILGAWKGRVVYARKIDKEYVWVNGACPEFLDSLPEWDG